MITKIAAGFVLVAPLVLAQQGEWQQCGGIGWTGGTTCISGTVCTALNDYYSQCLAGTATTTSTTSAATTTTTSTTTQPTSTATTTTTSSPSGPSVSPNYWFAFGDSYTTTGFDPSGTLPTIGNPLGNPAYPGYTGAGGVNWIDVDTIVYNKSLILTYNYAYGGATINSTLVAPYEPTVLSLDEQVNQFLAGAATKPATAPWTSSNSLFSFWIGINDIGNSWYQSGDRGAFAEVLLADYFAAVQKTVSYLSYADIMKSDVGGRNFLFINVPPVDRSPLMAASGADAQAGEKAVIIDFNTRLATHIADFKGNNSGVTTWLWDSWTAFSTVLDDPTAYGFVDNTSYGNAGDFWGNNYHPSDVAQTLWGQDVASLLSGTIWL